MKKLFSGWFLNAFFAIIFVLYIIWQELGLGLGLEFGGALGFSIITALGSSLLGEALKFIFLQTKFNKINYCIGVVLGIIAGILLFVL